jgi:hypothetical protein
MIYHAKPPSVLVRRGHTLAGGLVRLYAMTEKGGSILRDFARGAHATSANGIGFGSGPWGPSTSWNGTNQTATASDAGLPVGAAPRTLAAWFHGVTGSDDVSFFTWGVNGFHTAFTIYAQASGPIFAGVDLWFDGIFGTIPLDSGPHCIVATYDGTTLRLFTDGRADGSSALAANTTQGGTAWVGSQFGTTRLLSRSLDAVAVWNRALSRSEIAGIGPDPCAVLRPRRLVVPVLAAAASPPAARFRRTLGPRVGSRGVA